jgi:hypothetical protein
MRIMPLYTQSDAMVECYIRSVKEHLWKIVTLHQRDWDARLPIFLLAYRTSALNIMGLTSASLVFGREFQMHCPPPTRNDPQLIMRQI